MDRIIGGHFHLRRRIGAGSFGEIYSGEDTRTHQRVAVKLENFRTRVPQLSYESKLYTIFSGGIAIPKLHWYGTEDRHNVMVIDLLGKSLEDLFVACGHRFSLKTVLMLADQMLSCLEYIHNKNFIHRDVKPDNFMMGLGDASNQVFIIDFGLAKKYRDPHTHDHITYVDGKSLTGTARYASVGALRGIEQSRRDDLESLGFVWLYLLRGSLPWMGLTGRDQKQKHERICDVKSRTTFEELCRGFPVEFVHYFRSVRNLRFAEKPNYTEFRAMFHALFIREGFVYDYKYDWVRDVQIARPLTPDPVTAPVRLALRSREVVEESPQRPDSILISSSRAQQPADTARRQRSAIAIVPVTAPPPLPTVPPFALPPPPPPLTVRPPPIAPPPPTAPPPPIAPPQAAQQPPNDYKAQSALATARTQDKQRPRDALFSSGRSPRTPRKDISRMFRGPDSQMIPRRPRPPAQQTPPTWITKQTQRGRTARPPFKF
jgi:casein kinase 1